MSNTNNSIKFQEEYDAIVVGTGISGGWAAKELCETCHRLYNRQSRSMGYTQWRKPHKRDQGT